MLAAKWVWVAGGGRLSSSKVTPQSSFYDLVSTVLLELLFSLLRDTVFLFGKYYMASSNTIFFKFFATKVPI